METKKWYQSKTMWVNIIATVAIILQMVMGTNLLDTDTQAGILAVVNLILRVITKTGIS